MTHLFAYGSLLNPASLVRTLPLIGPEDCVPVVCAGYRRTFDVAFPNDGSQADKSYFDESGRRPAFVLMANMVRASGSVNGICFPVSNDELELLRARELRYRLIDVSDRIDSTSVLRRARVLAFVGRAKFVRRRDASRGVVSREYWETIRAGVAFWDQRSSGFLAKFESSTLVPDRVVTLQRVDHE